MMNKFYGVSLVALSLVMSAGTASAQRNTTSSTVTVSAEVKPAIVVLPEAQITSGALTADFGAIDLANVTADLVKTVDLVIINNTTGGDLTIASTSGKAQMDSLEKDSAGNPVSQLDYAVNIEHNGGTLEAAAGGEFDTNELELDAANAFTSIPVTVTLAKAAIEAAKAGKYAGAFTLTLLSK